MGHDAAMAKEVTGRTSGRAQALTAITPLKWWGPVYLMALYWLLGCSRVARFGKLDRLQVAYSIRWTLLPAFDRTRRFRFKRPNDQRRQLLFEANFEGDWDEYLENLGAVYGGALDKMFTAGMGYPGAVNPGLFKTYIRAHDHLPEQFVAAYDDITPSGIRQELEARYGSAARRAAQQEGLGRSSPHWSTFLVPLRPGQAAAAALAARALGPPGTRRADNLLLATGRIHFGRVLLCNQASGTWLLVTLTHDGAVDSILTELFAGAAGEHLRALLECAEGVPVPAGDWWDDDRLVTFLLDHRPCEAHTNIAYCGYPGFTVPQIRSFADDPRRDNAWPVQDSVP